MSFLGSIPNAWQVFINDAGETRTATINLTGDGVSKSITVTQIACGETEIELPPIESNYKMELSISGDVSEYFINIDHFDKNGHILMYVLRMPPDDIMIHPEVFRVTEDGSKTCVTGEIQSIRFYLDGVEYDTLATGELGTFAGEDLMHGSSLTIVVTLADGTVVMYEFTYDFSLVGIRSPE